MIIGVGAAVASLALLPGVANADQPSPPPGQSASAPPSGTPAGSGGGCKANGQAISGAAQTVPVPFGQIVSGNAPIADDNAAFFTVLCSGGSSGG